MDRLRHGDPCPLGQEESSACPAAGASRAPRGKGSERSLRCRVAPAWGLSRGLGRLRSRMGSSPSVLGAGPLLCCWLLRGRLRHARGAGGGGLLVEVSLVHGRSGPQPLCVLENVISACSMLNSCFAGSGPVGMLKMH